MIHQRDISRLCCRDAPHHCHQHANTVPKAATPTTVRTNVPPMLFWLKYNSVSPVKLRTGSSVPAIAQRRTNAQTKHNPSQQTLTNTCSQRLPMLTKHEKDNTQAHETRSNTCRHAHNRLPCCKLLTQHQHHGGRPLNHSNTTNMQCDSPTRYLASVLP